MSDGIKAWHEEEEEAEHQKRLTKINKKTDEEILELFETIKQQCESFISTNPSLTKKQWHNVEEINYVIKKIFYD
jgi:hypothetical protein